MKGPFTAVPWRQYRKSSASASAACCVEVLVLVDHVLCKDSKQNSDPDQPVISLSLPAWLQVLDEVLGLVPSNTNGELDIERDHDTGGAAFTCLRTGVQLSFNRGEMAAYDYAVGAGELTPELVPA